MRISWLGLFAHQGITTKGGILAIEVAANFSAATDFKLMHLVTCGAMLGSVPQLFSNACNWSKERNHSIIQQRLLATEGVLSSLFAVVKQASSVTLFPCDRPLFSSSG
ncbi:uncharacterized protein LOC135597700 isoform X1 [Musa acuminata AAA Group]|uniref:uncharacterized protein LOC135597700 isoform X1 n=1 Tax=Musa acuminata AAA Group TaxID=214697 RepID=UPI0031CEEE1A